MMKRFRLIYTLALTALLALTACQQDNILDVVEQPQQGGEVPAVKPLEMATVRLHVSPAGSSALTRAITIDKENALEREMMNLWTVVIVDDATGEVVEIQSCKPSSDSDEIDDLTKLPANRKYRFYSFANIGPAYIAGCIGVETDSIPNPTAQDVVASYKKYNEDGTVRTYVPATGDGPVKAQIGHVYSGNDAIPEGSGGVRIEEKTADVQGNNFDRFASGQDNNFGSYGIPMSNVQTIDVGTTGSVSLVVVRMFAKIELHFFNRSGEDIRVKSAKLTGVTDNQSGTGGNGVIGLLPNYTINGGEGAGTTENIKGDLKPNVLSTATKEGMTVQAAYVGAGDGSLVEVGGNTYLCDVPKTLNSTDYTTTDESKFQKVVFYVNESSKPTTDGGLFRLTLELTDATGNTSAVETTYALISDNAAGDWSYIARNDYRIIPVVLDYYKMEMTPVDFPPIGVYPSSVKELSSGLYQIDFHDYGHFHLEPKVTNNKGDVVVPFTKTTPSQTDGKYTTTEWGLVENSFSSSFTSYTDESKATVYDNSTATPAFYATSTDTGIGNIGADASENGGIPTFDLSKAAEPYIFGKIAPHDNTQDYKVYHEFKTYLYIAGTPTRKELTYKFYMVLDKDHVPARRR